MKRLFAMSAPGILKKGADFNSFQNYHDMFKQQVKGWRRHSCCTSCLSPPPKPDSAKLRHALVSTRPQTNTALASPPRPPRLKGIRSLIVSGVGGPPFV